MRELLEETGYSGVAQLVATAFDDAYSTMVRSCVVVTEVMLNEWVKPKVAVSLNTA